MPDKIELDNVTHSYGAIPVLRKVSLKIERGESVQIGGRSGSGKSTLLEICAGLIMPHSGTVSWDGLSLRNMQKQEIYKARHHMGYVFQVNALISNHSVFDNIALPLRTRRNISEKDITRKVRDQMELLGLFNIDNLFPESLSVGQLKTVAIARALIVEPDILLLDEPLSGLDPQAVQGVVNVLQEYRIKKETTIIMINNEKSVPEQYPSRMLLLNSGKLENASDTAHQEIE